MTAIDASSGNTGLAYAGILQPLGINLRLIVSGSVPPGKLAPLRFFGEGVEIVMHSSGKGGESTVERARREAREFGYVALDQYASKANPEAHELLTAPALWDLVGFSLGAIVIPLGTCGTALGFSRYLRTQLSNNIKIIGVATDPLQRVPQIPGMRTLPEIERDVLLPWKGAVDEVRLALREAAVRRTRELRYICPLGVGLSTGAAYDQALSYVVKHVLYLTGKTVIVLSPDSMSPYLEIMNAEQDDATIGQALTDRPAF